MAGSMQNLLENERLLDKKAKISVFVDIIFPYFQEIDFFQDFS